MNTRIGLDRLTLLTWLLLSTGQVQAQEVAQTVTISQVVDRLTHAERDQRIQGLDAYARIPAAARTQAIKRALIQSLELDLNMGRAIATGKMPPLPWDANHDFRHVLVHEVLALRDPETIPVLVRTIDMAGIVAGSLADYGRLALPALIDRIDRHSMALEQTLSITITTLRAMVERHGLNYFTADERASLRDVAIRFLDLKPGDYPTDTEIPRWQVSDSHWRPTRLARAMQLAWVLGEPELRDKVMAIATDFESLQMRGLAGNQIVKLKWYFDQIISGEPLMPSYSITIDSVDQQ